jgi:uncharacterized membrane protein HdeD (DUF308 family)
MPPLLASILRTVVPVTAGAVITWLLSLGISVDSASLAMLLTGVITSIYYLAARTLEQIWPALGALLLGLGAPAPTYATSGSDFVLSMIRTWVPVAAGFIVAWLANYGFQVDSTALAVVLMGVATGGYYIVARFLEQIWPALGRILISLGVVGKPEYPDRPLAAHA